MTQVSCTPAAEVVMLGEPDRPAILAHMLALPAGDRWLRFGHSIRPEALARLVERMDFSRDAALGVRDAAGELAGFTHVAVDRSRRRAEIGVGVLPGYRGRGMGGTMLREALARAAALGLEEAQVYFRLENRPMVTLARKLGFSVEIHGGDAIAAIRLRGADAAAAFPAAAAVPCPV